MTTSPPDPQWFVLPARSKKVGSGPLARWQECVSAMEETGAIWGDETSAREGLCSLLHDAGRARARPAS